MLLVFSLKWQESLTRDIRTVFVSDLQVKVDEKWLRHYFEQAGTVLSIKRLHPPGQIDQAHPRPVLEPFERHGVHRDGDAGRRRQSAHAERAEDVHEAQSVQLQRFPDEGEAQRGGEELVGDERARAAEDPALHDPRLQPPPAAHASEPHRGAFSLFFLSHAQLFEAFGDVDNVTMDLDEHKQFKGSANIKFRRPGRFVLSLSPLESASRAATRMDGQVYFDRKLSVQLLQRSGRNWKYEDREDNIILDPSRRSLMMRHIAENKNDPTLLDTMNQVNNRGQIAVREKGGNEA